MSFFENIDIDKLKLIFRYNPEEPLLFNSGLFLWLFAGFLLVYILLNRKDTLRILYVTLFSYYFYYKCSGSWLISTEPRIEIPYFFLLVFITVSDFFLARMMAATARKGVRKLLVTLSLCINLGILCYFKYTNFLGDVFASITGGTFSALDIFLPVGISFFAFQSLS